MSSRANSKNKKRQAQRTGAPARTGLYDPQFEHEACGVGFVVNIKGRRSHGIIQQALQALLNLDHRGACGCETNTGDGAGILIQTPHEFLKLAAREGRVSLPDPRAYGVGMVFLPAHRSQQAQCEKLFDEIVAEEGQRVLGWRTVPTNHAPLGKTARAGEPVMRQVFIARNDKLADDMAFERKLYVIRKRAEHAIRYSGKVAGGDFFYVASLSCKTLIYKGMLLTTQLQEYYPDLLHPAMESALALVHSRFSTNTFPSWNRAHPYRYMAHNGEINTLRGNINWMHARQALFQSGVFGDDIRKILPVICTDGSDSAMFDNCLELLVLSGRSLPHAMMMMIPEPWTKHESMTPEKKAFYEYHACLMEPWDGPASIAFTDGTRIGAVLDRNGLRPSRYYVTKDDLVVMASEVGVLDIPPERVLQKDRLQPGRMFLIDTEEGRIVADEDLKQKIATEQPYRLWLDENLVRLADVPDPRPARTGPRDGAPIPGRFRLYLRGPANLDAAHGPRRRRGRRLHGHRHSAGRPVRPPAVAFQLLQATLRPGDQSARRLHPRGDYHVHRDRHRLGAQPAGSLAGTRRGSSNSNPPSSTNEEFAKLKHLDLPGFKSVTLPILFKVADGPGGLEKAMDQLCVRLSQAVADGYNVVVLSDRGVNREWAPIPSLLAVAGAHHHLIRQGTRTRVGLVLESGEPREVHHFSLLIGYGCGAINPYLAFQSLDDLIRQGLLTGMDHKTACKNYLKAAMKGVVKVISKMGISTIQSYWGAQIFEAIGLKQSFIDRYFTWTPSRVEGVAIEVIAQEALAATSAPSRTGRSTATPSSPAANTSGAKTVSFTCSIP